MELCTRRWRSRRSGRPGVALGIVLLAFAVVTGAQVSLAAPEADGPGFWLLTEYDWGDDPETVVDSIRVSPGFRCAQGGTRCKLVRVSVDGEELVARFEYEKLQKESLWRVAFLTPPLDRKQADDHLARVWGKLAGYVSRFQEKPLLATELPSFDALKEGEPHYTHFWKSDEMEIRIALGLSDGSYYVGAYFYDPKRSQNAQERLAPRVPKAGRRGAARAPSGGP